MRRSSIDGYKIRGDKLVPNDAYKKGWNEIFGKKIKKDNIQKENEAYLKEIKPLFSREKKK